MKRLKAEELGAALKGATVIDFWVLPNRREVMLETTAGCVTMTNEMVYQLFPKTASNTALDSRAKTRKMEKVPVPFVPDHGC